MREYTVQYWGGNTKARDNVLCGESGVANRSGGVQASDNKVK